MSSTNSDPRQNCFLGEVRLDGGIGLEYRMASGKRGVLWLIEPADQTTGCDGRMTVLGEYLQISNTASCKSRV